MSQTLSENNPYYSYKFLDKATDFLKDTNAQSDFVVSYYVLEGQMSFKYEDKEDKVLKDEVIIFSSIKNLSDISISGGSKIFEVTSSKIYIKRSS